MAYLGLSLSGVLWLNGTTVINEQSAYNNGLLRIQDYIDAHTSNTTQGTTAPDQHDWTHILLPTLVGGDIAVSSSNSPANLGIWGKSVMTRIHNLEGNGSDWASGSAVTTMVALNAALANLVSGATTIAHATAASSLDTPQSYSTLIADYKVKVSGANGTVLVSVGGAYSDSLGGYIAADAVQRTVSLPAQPSAGNIQYCWITKPPTVPIPHASTNGAVGAAPAVPTYPAGEEPCALVIWRGSAAGGIVAAVDIIDIRYGHSFLGSGGGGGGSYTPVSPLTGIGSFGTTVPVDSIISGTYTNVTPINGVRVDRLRIPDSMLSPVYTDATQADQNAYLATGPFKTSIVQGATAGTLVFNPPVGIPLTVQIGNNKKRIDASMSLASRTTNNISAFGAGIYMMVADMTAIGPGWVPTLYGAGTAVPQPGLTQMFLGYVIYDGTSFYLSGRNGHPQFAIQSIVSGTEVQPLGAYRSIQPGENYASLAVAAVPTPLPLTVSTQTTTQVPNGIMSAKVLYSALVTAPGSVQQFYLFPMYYNSIGGTFTEAGNVPRSTENTIPAGGARTVQGWARIQPIYGGPLVVTLGYASGLVGFGIQQIQWDVIVERV